MIAGRSQSSVDAGGSVPDKRESPGLGSVNCRTRTVRGMMVAEMRTVYVPEMMMKLNNSL